MELSVNSRLKRAAQISKLTSPAARAPVTAGRPRRTDRQDWSQAALSFLQEVNRQDMESQRKLLEKKQRGGSELDMMEKSLKVMDKCRIIAARIQRGDKVPPQDERFLMEADPDGYKLAIAARQPKKNPKEWDTVLEEEDLEGGSAPAVEPAECESSGGEAAEEA